MNRLEFIEFNHSGRDAPGNPVVYYHGTIKRMDLLGKLP